MSTDPNAQAAELDRQAVTARENGQPGTARDLEQQAQKVRAQMLASIRTDADGNAVEIIN